MENKDTSPTPTDTDPVLRVVSERLQKIITGSSQDGSSHPLKVILRAIVLSRYSFNPAEESPPAEHTLHIAPADALTSYLDAPGEVSPDGKWETYHSLLDRYEGRNTTRLRRRTKHPFPRLTSGELVGRWIVTADHVALCTDDVLSQIQEKVEAVEASMRSDPLGNNRFYEFGQAEFALSPEGDELYMDYQVGPLYGAGDTYELTQDGNAVGLEQIRAHWRS